MACYKNNHTSSYYPLSIPCCNDTEVIAQLSINVRSQYSGINGFKLKPCKLLGECWQTSMTKAACPHRFYHPLRTSSMGATTGISLSSSSAGFTFKEPIMFSSRFLIKVVTCQNLLFLYHFAI